MNNDVNAVYVHIPFCNNICSYCDFCKMYYNFELVDKYLDALDKEIKEKYQNNNIRTLYIGGGTPSSLTLEQIDKLFLILKQIKVNSDAEITFEMNVNDITEELLQKLKDNKVNRISIGIETINDKFLKLLNRNHTKQDVISKIDLSKKYFNNINVDFMYAFPDQTLDDLILDLEFFKTLDVNHISIYSLILEKNTKLYIDNVSPLNEEVESRMYYYIINYLKNLGYIHYEVSNFAKRKYQSNHNLVYWNNQKYYGFGLGASGFINNIRYTNTRSINHYLEGDFTLEEEVITKKIDMENEMILGLRKMEGVNIKTFFDKYKINITDAFDIDDLLDKNIIKIKDNYIYIDEKYLYLSNQILVRFIDT